MIAKMAELPEVLRRTLTWDQGTEMASHAQIAKATDLSFYFCDPHSPWQPGTNENTKGLLRQYFSKGTDLSLHGSGYLDLVAAELNNRPRKTLNWRTPRRGPRQATVEPTQPTGCRADLAGQTPTSGSGVGYGWVGHRRHRNGAHVRQALQPGHRSVHVTRPRVRG